MAQSRPAEKNGQTVSPAMAFLEGLLTDTMLVCGVCQKHLHRPKLLPCVHSFCQRCVGTLIKDDCPKITCPTCNENFPVPKNRANGFKDSIFLSQLIGLLSVAHAAPQPCVVCDVIGREATLQCQECTDLLCKSCAKNHRKIKANKKHKLLKLAEVKKRGTYEFKDVLVTCTHHAGVAVTTFCLVCDSPACPQCLDDQHKFHRTAEFPVAATEKRALLRVTLSSLRQKSLQLQNLSVTTETLRTRLSEHKDRQDAGIEAKRKELTGIVDALTTEYTKNLENLLGQPLAAIVDHHSACQKALRGFRNVVDFGTRLLEHGSPRDIVLAEKEVVGRLKILDAQLKELQGQRLASFSQKSRIAFKPGVTGDVRGYYGNIQSEFPESSSDDDDDSDSGDDEKKMSTILREKPRTKPSLDMPVFDDDEEEDQKSPRQTSSDLGPLSRCESPWVPYFQQDLRISALSAPHVQARQRDELCQRSVTLALNKVVPAGVSTATTHLLDAQLDNEVRVERLCALVVALAGGGVQLAPTLALLCRAVTFLVVPTDGRPGSTSSVLTFLDRFCLRRFETAPGTYLGTGKTPAVSRSTSFTFSKRPSFIAGGTGSNTPTPGHRVSTLGRVPTGDLFARHRSHFGTWGGGSRTQTPVGTLSRSGSISSETPIPLVNINTDEDNNPYHEADRRRRNLALVAFLCEMFKLRMVAENILYEWIQRLAKVGSDLATEAIVCILLRVGRYLDHDRSRHTMNKVFVQLTYILGRRGTSGRIAAMLNDVIQLRDDEWQPRREYNYWGQLHGQLD